ncbi:hypothetical protein T01_5698 [Trichinella spiralis]|uniref:Uncharacterized protein n=1 Tax=Trichinella spiralis TaxID=6334 RepID=A0A0V1BJR4_TRISP|nr:hypothetical protein T01_5698 [Trichinella spiralis]
MDCKLKCLISSAAVQCTSAFSGQRMNFCPGEDKNLTHLPCANSSILFNPILGGLNIFPMSPSEKNVAESIPSYHFAVNNFGALLNNKAKLIQD